VERGGSRQNSSPAYDSLMIYFMSGTGNSYRASQWVAEEADGMGIPSKVIPIDAARPSEELTGGQRQLLGLFAPAHGFCAPWGMVKFALRLPRGRGAHAFVGIPRGGVKAGPLFIPGLEGAAAYILALILWLKGYLPRGVRGIDMPVSWLALHPGFSVASAKAIEADTRPHVVSFARCVLGGGTHFGWQSLLALALGVALLPITFLYVAMGRFFLAKLFFTNRKCNGCGLCARSCPFGAIRMVGRKSPRPYWRFRCESCMRCMAFCPQRAIEASHPWAVAMNLSAMIPLGVWVNQWLAATLGFIIPGFLVWDSLLDYPFRLACFFFGYMAFWFMARNSIIRTIFTYTTPTFLYRMYREPSTRLSDLARK